MIGFAGPTGKIMFTPILAALLVAGTAQATGSKVIGTGVALKGGKIYYASATARAPHTVSAKVIATPVQQVKIQWSVICTKGGTSDADAYNSSTTPKTGVGSISTPGTLKLALPFVHPNSCAVTIYSTLSKRGKQTLQVLQT